ncbi:DRBD4 [Trypanosoma brucei gambiense DAL972]|uniref:RNA-binding protein, putative n=2 Tax=Trypanosoma brucei TaxID=5691 RepID=D0A9V4_TRYB9|nr:DRBD4 [Trypanosoma brucei gambiense DAL972]RHW67763.1 Double RNA-binding domain containing protein 4 [Trypanosoma brucei equiperdum]CBH18455.1 DRBD4 [Trypanosoma brucei gambiense DAL972]|eukprot:XP_011780719.1 DRBD4 [Trypanosoma brucei gambiense DAL972]
MQTCLLSNIPPCTEDELKRGLLAYGTTVSTVVVPHMRQAAVTMRTAQEAQALLQRGCISLFGQTVKVEPAASPAVPYGAGGISAGGMNNHLGGARINVVVEKCTYPVTKEVLSQVFSMVAPPANVVCGPSGPTTNGWVDYNDIATAQRVVVQLNNNSIYPDCCFMTLTLEHMGNTPRGMGEYGSQGHMPYHPQQPQHQNIHQNQQMSQQQLQAMPFGNNGFNAASARGGRGIRGRARGRGAMGGRGGPVYGSGYPMQHAPYAPGQYGAPPVDSVVIVNSVPETVALHSLWVLLEVYGNVNSLKRQFSSKTSVIAHFQNVHDARLAVQHLQGCPFHGATLTLRHFAGYVERGGKTEWNSGPATDPATQAVLFSCGYHHRTRPTASFNPTGRVRPGRYLFVSNLTEAITDDDLKDVFTNECFELDGYYRKSPTVAIVSLKDVETAVNALIAVHSHQLKERFLRVTFSHFPPAPRSGTEEEVEQALAATEAEAAEVREDVEPQDEQNE